MMTWNSFILLKSNMLTQKEAVVSIKITTTRPTKNKENASPRHWLEVTDKWRKVDHKKGQILKYKHLKFRIHRTGSIHF